MAKALQLPLRCVSRCLLPAKLNEYELASVLSFLSFFSFSSFLILSGKLPALYQEARMATCIFMNFAGINFLCYHFHHSIETTQNLLICCKDTPVRCLMFRGRTMNHFLLRATWMEWCTFGNEFYIRLNPNNL